MDSFEFLFAFSVFTGILLGILIVLMYLIGSVIRGKRYIIVNADKFVEFLTNNKEEIKNGKKKQSNRRTNS